MFVTLGRSVGKGSGVFTGLVLLAACSTGTAAIEATCDPSPFRSDTPLVISHAWGNSIAPENTMLLLERGLAAGADILDLDLWATSDGVVVARHDRELSISTNGSGPIDQTTWAELALLDAAVNWTGEPLGEMVGVPRLDEALAEFPDHMFSLEIKQTAPSISGALCDVIEEANAQERVFISANDDDAAYGFQDVCDNVQLTTTYRDLDDRRAAEAAGEFWCSASPIGQPPFRPEFDAAFIDNAHAHGSAIFMWTINDPDDLLRMAEIGVDAVYTDRPDLARVIFDEFAANS